MKWLYGIFENPFYEIAIILALAALLGILGQILKQPLIVIFIALGILVGPAGLDIVASHDQIHLLAEIGIALLLFIVGLKLDVRIIRSLGKVSLLTGLGQVLFTSLFGYFIGVALGFPAIHSFYIAVALTFSSTIIIVKLLSDKKEIDVSISNTAPYKVYNIGNSSPVELMEYIGAIEQSVNREAEKEFLPMQQGDVPKTEADVSDLMENLYYKPDTPVKTGIERFIEWYKSYFKIQ